MYIYIYRSMIAGMAVHSSM